MIEWTGRGTDELKRFQKGSQEIGIFELSNLFGITTEASLTGGKTNTENIPPGN